VRVGVVKSGMIKKDRNSNSSVVIETVPNTSVIANMRETRFTQNGDMTRRRHITIKDKTKITTVAAHYRSVRRDIDIVASRLRVFIWKLEVEI
jgi:hypothetical protein